MLIDSKPICHGRNIVANNFVFLVSCTFPVTRIDLLRQLFRCFNINAKQIINNSSATNYDPYFPFAKMLATTASYLSGIPGGIFAPSLATGAGFGADLGYWLPLAPLSVMVLLGMVAYFSGVVQSPITAFVIVMEMTNNQDMMLAVIATSLIAHGTSKLVCPDPIYRTLALGFLAMHQSKDKQA